MSHTKDWRLWDRFDWNRQLVDLYFEGSDPIVEPVTRLDVSWQRLAALTNDKYASVDEVKEHFLERLNRSMGGASLLRAATSAGIHQGIPTYFLHLFVTCLVAAEAQEDQETPGELERDFRNGLCGLLSSPVHDSNFDQLPVLWKKFAEWTVAPGRPSGIRPLVLPDPGIETLIGYSKRLVFPKIRDQKVLARLLSAAGLLMEDPPLALLVERLARGRREMSQDLAQAMDDLIKRVQHDPFSRDLTDHAFVAAVNTVSKNASLLLGDSVDTSETTLLLLDYADSFELSLAATSASPFRDSEAVVDEFQPSAWPYRVSAISGDPLVLEQVLVRGASCPISWLIDPGVVPFTTAEHGVPEALKRGLLEDASYVLLRQDRQRAFCAAFDIEPGTVRPSGVPRWDVVRSPSLTQFTSQQLEEAGLADVVVLHPRPVRNTLSFRDGYQVLGDYLGFRFTTPWLHAPGAIAVQASLDGAQLQLRKESDGWLLPDSDLFGKLEVEASYPTGRPQRKRVKLIQEPLVSTYKEPPEPNSWMVETLAGSTILSEVKTAISGLDEIEIADAVHRIFLGPVVGEFLPDESGAVWELSSFGSIKSVRALRDPDLISPMGRVADPPLCRAWRRALERFSGSADNEDVRRAINRSKAAKDLQLEVVESINSHSVRPEKYPDTNPSCRVVQAALGSYCSRRAGLQMGEWLRMLEKAFGIAPQVRRMVHRGWLEAGFIEEARRTQWSGGAIFARNPFIWVFRSGGTQFGSVEGLLMPTRLQRIEELASEMGLESSLNYSPSAYLPPRLMVRSTVNNVEEFAARVELEVRYLRAEPSLDLPLRDQHGSRYPDGYVSQRAFPTFETPEGVKVLMHSRSGKPRFWSASVADRSVWSFAPEALPYRICCELQVPGSVLEHGAELQARASFLPLSVARWLSSVSGVSPGPSGNTYLNVASSRQLAERVLHITETLTSSISKPEQ